MRFCCAFGTFLYTNIGSLTALAAADHQPLKKTHRTAAVLKQFVPFFSKALLQLMIMNKDTSRSFYSCFTFVFGFLFCFVFYTFIVWEIARVANVICFHGNRH